ncbi:MAG: hypothetical protein WC825_07030 [Gallionellaceae bacterium]|jgi:hypothetical protein
MKPFLAFAFSAFLFFAVQAANALEGCPVSDKEFLHQITSSGDWADVHAVFKRNLPACQDDGLYADGYTNLVVGVLATRWPEIDALEELMARDKAFKQFVFRHIGISAGEDDLRRVLRSAQASCPIKSARLCKEIATRCKRALAGRKS